jgi:starvation-inducible DNA-binding protein
MGNPAPDLPPIAMKNQFIDLLTAQNNLAHGSHLAHFNVDGPNFYQYHLLFEKVYEIVGEKIDPTAELARSHGVEIPAKIYHEVPELEWSTCEELAEELYRVTEDLCESMKKLHVKADEAEKYGVLSFVEGLMEDMAKVKYLLGSVTKAGNSKETEDEEKGED